jgi:hypothetical protein
MQLGLKPQFQDQTIDPHVSFIVSQEIIGKNYKRC